jgi:citrate synthase
MNTAKLTLDGQETELPVIVGSEGEVGLDIRALRNKTGAITFDSGYGNTGSCDSAITFIDGETGILRYRGYPIEELATKSSFLEVSYLLIYGELPTADELKKFEYNVTHHTLLHEDMKKFYEGFPPSAHPMSVLSSMVASLSAFYAIDSDPKTLDQNIIRLIAKLKTIAAFSYKKTVGQPFVYPRNDLQYTADFLHMMFALPAEPYKVSELMAETLDLLLILHADHEQNCSTSTVRMVGSSGADLFASISAGIGALSGPLHGGANQEVLQMLDVIHADNDDYRKYIDKAKSKTDSFKLMGFGHRVYKNFDPRARIIKAKADQLLDNLGVNDPLLDIARSLEEIALRDEYFIEKKLYPNVDFYSGILYRAMGIPVEMFTVMFAIGRLPGWIAQWKEMRSDPETRIYRPRQIYTGATERSYVDIGERTKEKMAEAAAV